MNMLCKFLNWTVPALRVQHREEDWKGTLVVATWDADGSWAFGVKEFSFVPLGFVPLGWGP